ncbi:phage tail tape measure protein [Bifidobacterium sp. ESL0728]|uniref:phage tail tape measure protein n=1 Tax=Bifidobacterium sp. ESL0728 TaxID=2983220 RepID=UPI0023F89D73|nr:phage tail tape measure protein [Bifidobacterium sp. ESL0728]WEV59670.1 phage tail tape measure protein [Bifidobacterium sp. ESL0728]
MATKKLMTAYYELIAATPNAEAQIASAVVPAAQKAGEQGGSTLGSSLVANLKKFAAPAAAALSVAGVAKFVQDSVKQFTNLTGSIASLQRITGGTTAQVSALQGAMRLSGMDASKANTSLTIFAKKLQGVEGDSKKTAAMQQLLGTSINDANGHLKPMSELLPQVADKFKSMPDGVEKTALATQLFGKSGTAMLPFLNQGSSGITALEAKAKSLGIVLDDNSKNKWAAYRSAVRNVNLSMEGMKTQIGEALIPVFTGFSNFIANSVTPTIQKLIQWFQSPAVQDFANKAGVSLSQLGTAIGNLTSQGMQKLKGLFNWVSQNKDWLAPIAVSIGTVATAIGAYRTAVSVTKTVTTLWTKATQLATTAQNLFNNATKANVLGLVATALAAVVAGLVYFFTQTETGRKAWKTFTDWLTTTSESIKAKWNEIWTSIGDFFKNVWEGMKTYGKTAVEFIVGFMTGGIAGVLAVFFTQTDTGKRIWAEFTQFFNEKVTDIKNWFHQAGDSVTGKWHEVTSYFGSIPGSILGYFAGIGNILSNEWLAAGDWVTGKWRNLMNWFSWIRSSVNGYFAGIGNILSNEWLAAGDWIDGKWNPLINWFMNIPGWIGGAFSNVANIIANPFISAFQSIRNWWNSTIGGFGFNVPDWLPGVGGKSFRVPMLANGGVLAAAGTVMVGERGPELLTLPEGAQVTPLRHNAAGSLSKADLVDAFAQALQQVPMARLYTPEQAAKVMSPAMRREFAIGEYMGV